MKRLSVILSVLLFAFLISSCGGEKTNEVKDDKKEVEAIEAEKKATNEKEKTVAREKGPAQILPTGSWSNEAAARGEDVIFNEDGTMLWRSGNDEGSDSWSIKGTDVLEFYGADYKIEELTETKLVVSKDGEKTTYQRNKESADACNPKFKVEGVNDAKGLYENGNVSWTIHSTDTDFIAFFTKDGKQDDALSVDKIVKVSNCEYSIMMKSIQGEKVPTWTLKFNEVKGFYDLYTYEYDAGADSWATMVYNGSKDNG